VSPAASNRDSARGDYRYPRNQDVAHLRELLKPYLADGVTWLCAGGGTRSAYGTNFDRLVAVKAKYDSDNFFRATRTSRPPDVRKTYRSSSMANTLAAPKSSIAG
jgi:hypothetical protein